MNTYIRVILSFIMYTFVYFGLVYAIGYIATMLGYSLYDSESDQQRNFNIVVGFWFVSAIFISFLFSRKKR